MGWEEQDVLKPLTLPVLAALLLLEEQVLFMEELFLLPADVLLQTDLVLLAKVMPQQLLLVFVQPLEQLPPSCGDVELFLLAHCFPKLHITWGQYTGQHGSSSAASLARAGTAFSTTSMDGEGDGGCWWASGCCCGLAGDGTVSSTTSMNGEGGGGCRWACRSFLGWLVLAWPPPQSPQTGWRTAATCGPQCGWLLWTVPPLFPP